MKKTRLGAVLVTLLFLQVFIGYFLLSAQSASVPDVFVGIDMAYGDSVAEAKKQIDEVSAYTNLFVLGCKGITYNTTSLNETCQYIADKGLNFMVFRDTPLRNATWVEMAKKTWGDRFLGYYAYDELGGWQIDMHEWRMVVNAANYSDAANSFVNTSSGYLDRFTRFRNTTQFNLYTSDYALYWFDYKAGYDTVFAEFGWNYSRQLNIALCRGAANIHGKDWGAIITWTYTQQPYLESGEDLYKDLVLAYESGAKYVILFDANDGWTESVLKPEHLDALKRFWEYVKENPRQSKLESDRVAYVLPKDYGYGFRGPNDKIWGFWEADNLTSKVCGDLSILLTQYDNMLDIIYDDGLQPGNNYGYGKLIYWNDTSLVHYSTPTPATSDSSATTTTQPSTSTPIEKPSSPMDYSAMLVVVGTMAVAAVPIIMLRKKQHCITFAQAGVGRDFSGTVVVVDGKGYDRYGISFWWDQGSRHTVEFKSPLVVNGSKQYILTHTNGLRIHEDDFFKVSRETTVTGNYETILKAGSRFRPR
jgi:hypothetical protein